MTTPAPLAAPGTAWGRSDHPVLAAAQEALARVADPVAARHAVLIAVARAARWPVGTVWVPAPGGWVSARQWYDADAARFLMLRRAVEGAPPGPIRGHLATALHLGVPRFAGDLECLRGTERHRLAVAAGCGGGVAVPVLDDTRPTALLDFLLPAGEPVDGPTGYALGAVATLLAQLCTMST